MNNDRIRALFELIPHGNLGSGHVGCLRCDLRRELDVETTIDCPALPKLVEETLKTLETDARIPPVDRSKQTLVDGSPVPEDRSHTALKPDGQQKGYVVLSEEERRRGFVRPLRRSYIHIGRPIKYPLRDLTPEEAERYAGNGYVKYEPYPKNEGPGSTVGRFWTQEELDRRNCKTLTTMSVAIAETYARDPKFYGGTFCCRCGKHYPLEEFVWAGTEETVGS